MAANIRLSVFQPPTKTCLGSEILLDSEGGCRRQEQGLQRWYEGQHVCSNEYSANGLRELIG